MKKLQHKSSAGISSWAHMCVFVTILLQSCFSDNYDSVMKFETLPIIPAITANGAPTPGNGGIMTIGIVTDDTVEFLWVRGDDDLTPHADLEYRVYRSIVNNISTPVDAEANGIVVTPWTKNIVAIVAEGLTPGTGYYFNVVVRDGDGNTASYSAISVTTQSVPVGYPVPGNGGIITNGVVSTTSIQLNWTRAEDTETPQGELWYRVYRSSGNNISTPALAEANGTVVTDWTRDIVTAVASGLSAGTGYYFNAVVRDGDGNTAAYVTISITTVADAIYMFPAGSYNGNLVSASTGLTTVAAVPVVSARDAVDGLCATAKTNIYPTLPCLNVRAFISIDAGDDIAGMPANYSIPTGRKIIGPTGIQIGDNWADLFDGTIDITLSDASIASDNWWSGSLSNGHIDSSNYCGGWTTTGEHGQSGIYDNPDKWIEGNTPSCSTAKVVLCVCW